MDAMTNMRISDLIVMVAMSGFLVLVIIGVIHK
jgi:hypothetical protein